MRYALTLIFVASGLWALEANMFQQQAYNVYELQQARQRRFTPTRTRTPRAAQPTATASHTPDPRWTRTPSQTVTPSPTTTRGR